MAGVVSLGSIATGTQHCIQISNQVWHQRATLIAEWFVLWVKSAASAYEEPRKILSRKPSGTLVFEGYPNVFNPKCNWSRPPLFAYARYATLDHFNATYLGDAICTADLQTFPIDQ